MNGGRSGPWASMHGASSVIRCSGALFRTMGWCGTLSGMLTVLFVILLLASCNRGEQPEGQFRVESHSSLSSASFNKRLSNAAEEGEPWARDPIRIALEFMNSQGARSVKIDREDQGGEAHASTRVTVVEDGYLDDSVRGSWTRFTMKRLDDGPWRIANIQKAYRCWRGHHQESYSARLCP